MDNYELPFGNITLALLLLGGFILLGIRECTGCF